MINLKSRLMKKGLIVIVLPLVLEFGFISMLAFLLFNAQLEFERRIESKQIVIAATQVVARLIDAEMITMMYNAQPVPFLDVRFDEDCQRIRTSLGELRTRTASSSRRAEMFNNIEASVTDTLKRLRKVFSSEIERDAKLRRFAYSDQRTRKTYRVFTSAFNDVNHLLDFEQKTQASVSKKEQLYREGLNQALIWGMTLSISLTVGLAIYFTGSITRRIRTVLDNTRCLRHREALAEPIGGDDEISQLDEVLHATAEDLSLVDRQRKHLVSLVRDELSAPLQQVQFVLHNLSQGVLGELSERAENRLTMASRDTDRVMRLIDDLLSIEDMEGARFDLDLAWTSSDEVVSVAMDSVAALAQRARVRLEKLGKDVGFEADRDRIVQVLINLLSNAIKYSPEGERVILSVAQDGDSAEFKVRDNGRGIPADKLSSIFEPFQQVEESDQTARGGTGLGLPICKKIVEQHGGTIDVSSEPGAGSTFRVVIPIPEREPVEDADPGK